MAEEQEAEAPECCKGCLVWQQFKDKCWVYWEKKKSCTMFAPEYEMPQNPNNLF